MSFEDEVRAFIKHKAEQNPVLHRLQAGEMTFDDIDDQQALQMLASVDAMQTQLLIKIAHEIDALRAGAEGR